VNTVLNSESTLHKFYKYGWYMSISDLIKQGRLTGVCIALTHSQPGKYYLKVEYKSNWFRRVIFKQPTRWRLLGEYIGEMDPAVSPFLYDSKDDAERDFHDYMKLINERMFE
jgi:hypothetical protein